MLYVALFSSSTIELAEGTYPLNTAFLEGNLLEGAAVDGNFSTGALTIYNLTGGSVTLSKSGNTWTFTFEFNAEAATGGTVDVNGSYSGMLTVIE